ncbi:MAG: DUF6141 family protein [Bacteroidota bacterium]
MSKIIFREVQKVRQWWIWAIVGLLVLGYGFIIFERLVISSPFEPHVISIYNVFALGGIPLVIFIFTFTMKLITEICDDGIYYKFFPFMLRYHFIPWNEIEKVYMREYHPISDYGGWGIRFGSSHGKAFNVSGNWGLQIELKNGKKVLFGTQKRASMENVIIAIKEKTGIKNFEMYDKSGL